MQVALIEATREVVRMKTEREDLAVRLEEVQCLMGGRIGRLRPEIEGSSHAALKTENEVLRSTVVALKVCFLVMGADGEGRLEVQSKAAQDRIARLERELVRHRKLYTPF